MLRSPTNSEHRPSRMRWIVLAVWGVVTAWLVVAIFIGVLRGVFIVGPIPADPAPAPTEQPAPPQDPGP